MIELTGIIDNEPKKLLGEMGVCGMPGPAGPAGPQGEKGDKGDKGDAGVSVSVGDTITGEPGT